jgi:putative SOS response-associated peptidase YedK
MLAAIHDRMPAILAPEACATWLDPAATPDALTALLVAYPEMRLRAYPVAKRVGQVANDDPEIVAEVAPEPPPAPKPARRAKAPSRQGDLF